MEKLRSHEVGSFSVTKLILSALSFSVLNPQAILDTLVIVGGNANHYTQAYKYHFTLGVIVASFIWFFSLAGSASASSRLLQDWY